MKEPDWVSCTEEELWKYVYIHFNANECLDQAAMVAKRHKFDLNKVKKWCEGEGGAKHFEEFKNRIEKKV